MKETIIFSINFSEEEIQTFAEDNFGRKLTDAELNQIKEYWWDYPGVFIAKLGVLESAIKEATDTIQQQKTEDKE